MLGAAGGLSHRASHLRPWPLVKGLARGLDGDVDVGGVAFRHLRDDGLVVGVDGCEGLARHGVHELAIDEKLQSRATCCRAQELVQPT